MPQMSPINWLYLIFFNYFIYDNSCFYLLFMYKYGFQKNNFFVMNKCLIWKW